ncbi:MAG: hydroxymethylbilane synthase [Pseudomonadota bacterium]|nr:hydroxymethylbilane synthase [Pseudomonadota bacterium]QKK04223.1 MAG: hydroxymethylbilane synthase [Pseudomonadota bacterium]
MEKPLVTIGTRGSRLALIQTHMVADALRAAHPSLAAESAIAIEIITTSGDKIQDRSLLEAGGKGLFIKEIEEALFAGRIDMAVHSMKDVPAFLPDEGEMACILPREDAHDAFLSVKYASLEDLPKGATLGTAGVRRKAFALAKRPDLNVVLFRGNVETRLQKLRDGVADATFLAVAGLNRLGLTDEITAVMDADDMLPAAGQGAVGVEIRKGDTRCRDLLAPVNCPVTALCVAAERGFIAALDGSCKTPIAAHAVYNEQEEKLTLEGALATENGEMLWHAAVTKPVQKTDDGTASAIGDKLGRDIRAEVPQDILDQLMGRVA